MVSTQQLKVVVKPSAMTHATRPATTLSGLGVGVGVGIGVGVGFETLRLSRASAALVV